MLKIKYVGLKTAGEQAFMEQTGLTWMPGYSHDVSVDHAALMLKHPDVFALGDVPQSLGLGDAKPAAVLTPAMIEASTFVIEKPEVPLEAMTREALHALAKARGVKVHHTSGAAKVIEALQAAPPVPVKPE